MSESVLVVDGGGRGNALAEAIALSPDVEEVYCAPGSPGTAMIDKVTNLPFGTGDLDEIVSFARHADDELLVVVGQEAPLVAGLADRLRADHVPVFGPSAAAARLEGSKVFACKFMDLNGIPQPESNVAMDIEEAMWLIGSRNPEELVLKADGLAGGKGVVLPNSEREIVNTVHDMLTGRGFDGAGRTGIVIQERLTGPELSVFVASDGQNFSVVPFFAQDHKRRDTGDKGPNTGGMGAYTPVPEDMLHPRQLSLIHQIAANTINGMSNRETPYQGFLYLGLMLAKERGGDPVVIEYNARLGDPESQVTLPTLINAGVDVHHLLRETAHGRVPDLGAPQFAGRAALTVCLAAKGYPENPKVGAVIHGWDKQYPNVTVYHGGTKRVGDELIVNGGRVLYVTGQGETVDDAAAAAYAAIGDDGLHFSGMHYRTDIGHQARRG